MRCRHAVTCVAVGNASLDGLQTVRGWQCAQRVRASLRKERRCSWHRLMATYVCIHVRMRLHRCEVYTWIMTSDSSSPTPARPETSVPSEAGEAGPCREPTCRWQMLSVVVPRQGEGLGFLVTLKQIPGGKVARSTDTWGEGSTKLEFGWSVESQAYYRTHNRPPPRFCLFCADKRNKRKQAKAKRYVRKRARANDT